jgi:predicted ATPase
MLHIPRYQLEEQIGVGAMGAVYRALDRLTGQMVALKLVTTNTSVGDNHPTPLNLLEEKRLALAQEFRILSSIHHPNIIGVSDYGFDEDRQPYFTMEYLPNAETLVQASLSQPLKEQVKLLCQVLQALAYLHRRKILHRDLKPNNILVQDGRARILDFGLSVGVEEAHGRAGTLAYMAPEILHMGIGEVASDLYAFGVIAFEIFSGRLPFANNDIHGILTRRPVLGLINGPAELRQVIGKLMEKNPDQRYASADETLAALAQAVGMFLPVEESAVRESYLQAAQFVGREKESEQLLDALHKAQEGRGSIWFVDGESGVGKTRLFDEIRTHILVSGATVVRGQAAEGSGSPYQVWQEPLRQLVLTTPLTGLQAGVLGTFIPDLAELLGRAITPLAALESSTAQQRLNLTIADVLQTAAKNMPPLVVILEDLQFAPESLGPLEALAHLVQDYPLLIVANYRSDEAPVLTQEMEGVNRLTLSRLTYDQVAQLSKSMLGSTNTKPEIVEWLTNETEGNVFFLVETVRELAEEVGQLELIGFKTLPDSILARGVQQVLQRRLNRMPAAGQSLLTLAAIAGRALDLPLLSALAPDMDLNSWLIAGANVAVLEEHDGHWQFAHDKLRETLLSGLEAESRPQLYRQVAETCERIYPQTGARAAALSTWWRNANEPEKEFKSARLAGEYALTQYFMKDAERFFTRALELCPPTAVSERYDLLSHREKVYNTLEKKAEQLKDIESLEALFDLVTPKQRAQVKLQRANYEYAVQNYAGALEILNIMLKSGGETQLTDILSSIHLLLGVTLVSQSAYDDALKHLKMAVVLCQRVNDKQGEARALMHMNMIHYDRGENYIELNDRAMDIFRAIGDKSGESICLTIHGNHLDDQGDRVQALECYKQALQLQRQLGAQRREAITLVNIGFLHERLGNYDDAYQCAHQSWQIVLKIGNRELEIAILATLASVCFSQQKYGEARIYASRSVEMGESLGSRYSIPAYVVLGHTLISLNELDEAKQTLYTAQRICDETGYTRVAADLLHGLARLALARADNSQALTEVEKILQLRKTDPALVNMSDEPMRVFATCYAVLQAHHDPRAAKLLQEAHEQLETYADKITDTYLRRMYLEVPANWEIHMLWHSRNPQ